MAKDWKLTAEQKAYLDRLSIWFDQTQQQLKLALDESAAERTAELELVSAVFDDAMNASFAEIEEYSIREILDALRKTYGAKPDPTRRLELLHDRNGQLPEYVSIRNAQRYARVTERRIEQLVADEKLRAVGGKGHRRVLVADLVLYYPPEK